MDNRLLTKLLSSPITNLTWSKIKRIKQLMTHTKDVHSSSLNSDTVLMKSASVTKLSTEQKYLLKGLNKMCENGFSTSTSNGFWNKQLTAYDEQQFQVPSQLYAQKAEVGHLLVEGVGWAGQPVVRRTHPILPEVYGDISDIFTAVEKFPANTRVREEALPRSQANFAGKTTTENGPSRPVYAKGEERSPKNPQHVKDSLVDSIKTTEETEVKSRSRSSDVHSFMNENSTSKHIHIKEADTNPLTSFNKMNDNGGVGKKSEATKSDKRLKKLKDMHLKSVSVLTKQKKKSKKMTKVCSSKANIPLITKKKTKKSKKNNGSTFGDSKKRSLQSNSLFSQRESDRPARKSVIILANRQLQTHSQPTQAKVSINIKEKTSTTILALGKKLKTSSKESEGKYPEDCKCPETLETKTRYPTKICGEAAGAQDKKKKKEWKGKMCPVEHQLKHRTRTVVCNSAKFGKAKRKRQLPKCEKPEKKIAPRVLICPPQLEEELKQGEKKCVKQIEEIKVRSRTKVCKPVIMYLEEKISQVVVQKAVCTEKKVKKTISRHTKVCPPSEENKEQKKSKR